MKLDNENTIDIRTLQGGTSMVFFDYRILYSCLRQF